MTPRLLEAFLAWLVRRIAEALAEEQGTPVRESTVITPRVDGQVSTRQGNRITSGRQSNLNPRPGTPLNTTRLSPDTALGDTNRRSPPIEPPQGGVPIPARHLPSIPIASPAIVEEHDTYVWNPGGENQHNRFVPILARIPLAAGDRPHYPTPDDERYLLEYHALPLSTPSWLTTPHPRIGLPYHVGVLNGTPYLAGHEVTLWPARTTVGSVHLPLDGSYLYDLDANGPPDHPGGMEGGTYRVRVNVTPPKVFWPDVSSDAFWTANGQTNHVETLLTWNPSDEWSIDTIPVDVRRWERTGSASIAGTTYTRATWTPPGPAWEGETDQAYQGDIVLADGDARIGLAPVMHWWDYTIADDGLIRVLSTVSATRFEISDYRVGTVPRVFVGQEVIASGSKGDYEFAARTITLLEVIDNGDGTESHFLEVDEAFPSDPPDDQDLLFYPICPRDPSGTRYRVQDEFTVQVRRAATFTTERDAQEDGTVIMRYRAHPGYVADVSRTIRLLVDVGNTGNDANLTQVDETTKSGTMAAPARWVPGDTGIDSTPQASPLPYFPVSLDGFFWRDAQWLGRSSTRFDTLPDPYGPSDYDGITGVEAETSSGVVPTPRVGYTDLPLRRIYRLPAYDGKLSAPLFEDVTLVNPTVYRDTTRGWTLHNPFVSTTVQTGDLAGAQLPTRYGDACTFQVRAPPGEGWEGTDWHLYAVTLDGADTVRVAVDGTEVWEGSLWLFAPLCTGEAMQVTYAAPLLIGGEPDDTPWPNPDWDADASALPTLDWLHPDVHAHTGRLGPFVVRAAGPADRGAAKGNPPIVLHPRF